MARILTPEEINNYHTKEYLHTCNQSAIYFLKGLVAPLIILSALILFISETYRDFVQKLVGDYKYLFILFLLPAWPFYIIFYFLYSLLEGFYYFLDSKGNIY